jgi:hypothetical protein
VHAVDSVDLPVDGHPGPRASADTA